MTYQEAREYLGLRPDDRVDVESTEKFLAERKKYSKFVSRSLREDIEKDIKAIEVVLKHEKEKDNV